MEPEAVCKNVLACHLCASREDAVVRKLLCAKLEILQENFFCPFPELREANAKLWEARRVKNAPLEMRRASGGDCVYMGEKTGDADPRRPCRGELIRCLHPDHPFAEHWRGWCRPEKCKFFEMKK